MRVGISLLTLAPNDLGGSETYARQLVLALSQVGTHQYAVFVPAGLVLGPLAAAIVGVAAYSALVVLVRPRGLVASWSYLRALQ